MRRHEVPRGRGVASVALDEHLRAFGFEAPEAENGDCAKDMCVAEAHIDLVFTDVQMPGRMDGLALGRLAVLRHHRVAAAREARAAVKPALAARSSRYLRSRNNSGVVSRHGLHEFRGDVMGRAMRNIAETDDADDILGVIENGKAANISSFHQLRRVMD